MTLVDALTITALGMTVVFSGLVLTALLIISFGALPDPNRKSQHAPSAAPDHVTPTPPKDASVIAVITAVLEIERRLHRAETGGKLTIKRSS